MKLLYEPLLTTVMSAENLECEAGSIYLHSSGLEERSHLDAGWISTRPSVHVDEVIEFEDETVQIGGRRIALRDKQRIQSTISGYAAVYIDITGMNYTAWAPILAAALGAGCVTRVVYREPVDYKRSENPSRGMFYDLSERIGGISPIPGLASLRLRPPDDSVFVPLMGFEGARLAHVIESSEPAGERVVPIVGSPGFRPEYTMQALLAGRLSLDKDNRYSRLRFAKANCPFDLFHELVKIRDDFDGAFLRIAPVGTKPHGLGAVLFALGRRGKAEIVYDHPIRRDTRTSGRSRVCLYAVSEFAASDLFRGTGDYAS